MKKVLVTGGAGYIGSACSEYLLNLGYDVTIFDGLLTGHREAVDPRAKFILGNLSDREKIKSVCREGKFDAIMHFAAFSLVGESMKDPSKYFRNNIANGINLADAAVESGVKMFVFSSTAATFGQPESIPIKEFDRQIPINPYGESKLCFEKILKWYHEIYGINYAALRYFNAAGATENFGEDHRPETHLIPLILQTVRGKRDKLMLYGDDYDTADGTCVRDYIHVSDLADAHIAALKYLDRDERKYDAFNVGTGEGTSVRQIVDEVKKVTGLPFKETVMGRRAGDPPHLIGSPKRINEEMGWHAKYNVEDIVKSAWDAWQANPEHHIDVDTWKQTD